MQKIFGQCAKTILKSFFRRKILHKCSLWTQENSVDTQPKNCCLKVEKFNLNVCGFDNPVEQVRRKAESFLQKVGKWSRDFLQKTTSPQKVPMVLHNKVLKTLSNNFGGKIKIFFSRSEKDEKDLLTFRKQFWQSCPTVLARNLQVSASGSENDEEHFLIKK